MLRIIQGERPQRPAVMSEALWHVVTAAWAAQSHARPTIHDIVSSFPGSVNADHGYGERDSADSQSERRCFFNC